MPTSEEAATAAAAEALSDEAEETPSSTEGTVEEVEFPSFDLNISADLAAELEEDEEDLTVTDEELDDLAAENEEVPREMLSRMRAAEKRAEHLEGLRVKEARKNWAEEAAKIAPLSTPFLDEITATSRRGFLRTAKNLHERMQPLVEEKVLGPARAAIEKAKTDAAAEGREQAVDAWGKPLVSKQEQVPSEADVSLQATQNRRRRGELSDTIRDMIFPKEKK